MHCECPDYSRSKFADHFYFQLVKNTVGLPLYLDYKTYSKIPTEAQSVENVQDATVNTELAWPIPGLRKSDNAARYSVFNMKAKGKEKHQMGVQSLSSNYTCGSWDPSELGSIVFFT